MKRNIKRMVAIFGVVMAVICSVAPSYYVYAEDLVSQEVTSDDNIIQKLFDYSMSALGACNRNAQIVTSIPSSVADSVKETLASLMNGGGIYVDENGDYVFTDEACADIYDALSSNSSTDARVISNFNNFSYLADGYVNNNYLIACNAVTSFYNTYGSGINNSGINNGAGVSGDYLLLSARYESGNLTCTSLMGFDIGNVSYFNVNPSGNNFTISFISSDATTIGVPWGFCSVCFDAGRNQYFNMQANHFGTTSNLAIRGYYKSGNNNNSMQSSLQFIGSDGQNAIYNSFPNVPVDPSLLYTNTYWTMTDINIYCSKSVILSKTLPAGNGLVNQSSGIYYSNFENKVVNHTVLEENNWESIYNTYIQNVNIDYQEDPSISSSDFRKILKKYTNSIIDAIQNGSSNVEESISISNRYLQAISVDVRNISDKLDDISSGGSGGGITEEQYNSIMAKLNDINDNAIDIASSTATISSDIDAIYEDTHGISSDMEVLLENTGDTNTNLVAIHTLLNNINSKIGDRYHNPLPDDNFWMLLDDELDDYTNTMMEDLIFKLQMIGTVLQGVVPFGYLAVLNVMVNALAEEPEDPVFEIDLQSNGATAIPVNWQGTIDLSWVGDIMPIVRSFEVILFIIGLIWATFSVFTALGSIL